MKHRVQLHSAAGSLFRRALTAVVALGLAAVACAASASAQRADDYFGAGAWQVGGGVIVMPKFEGSKNYNAIGFPFVAPSGFGQGTGALQVRSLDDVRFRLLASNGFEFGVLGGYRFGRDSADSAKLAGFADIDGGLVLGGYTGYRAGPLFLSAAYGHQVTGDTTGGLVRLLAEYNMRLDRSTMLTASVGTNIASKEYMQSFFGVTPGQSGRLPAYNAAAGFKDVNVGLTATINLDPRWTLYLTGKYARLVGDAADSPIIDTRDQLTAGAGLSYKFDWVR